MPLSLGPSDREFVSGNQYTPLPELGTPEDQSPLTTISLDQETHAASSQQRLRATSDAHIQLINPQTRMSSDAPSPSGPPEGVAPLAVTSTTPPTLTPRKLNTLQRFWFAILKFCAHHGTTMETLETHMKAHLKNRNLDVNAFVNSLRTTNDSVSEVLKLFREDPNLVEYYFGANIRDRLLIELYAHDDTTIAQQLECLQIMIHTHLPETTLDAVRLGPDTSEQRISGMITQRISEFSNTPFYQQWNSNPPMSSNNEPVLPSHVNIQTAIARLMTARADSAVASGLTGYTTMASTLRNIADSRTEIQSIEPQEQVITETQIQSMEPSNTPLESRLFDALPAALVTNNNRQAILDAIIRSPHLTENAVNCVIDEDLFNVFEHFLLPEDITPAPTVSAIIPEILQYANTAPPSTDQEGRQQHYNRFVATIISRYFT